MTIPFIDLKSQYLALKPQINARIQNVLNHGNYIMGPEVYELEDKLSLYTEANYCITVSSGTEALLISLMALGVGPGDEVITTPFTFAATAEVIVLLGAVPIFVDIEPETCLINANLIQNKITSRTKAILPVSLYGQIPDMDAINEIAFRNGNLPVIEDGAQSFGAIYRGKKSCNLSTIGCTSFFPSKPLGCYGDGGAIFTNNIELAKACQEIRVHGQSERYIHTRIGVGGRMDTLQCAIVLAKLERLDWELNKRQELGARYHEKLRFQTKVKTLEVKDDRNCIWAQYTIFAKERNAILNYLKSVDIPTAIHYPTPLNLQPAYMKYCCPDCCSNSSLVSTQVMSLPMSPDLKLDEQNIIIEHLINALSID